MVVPLTTLDGSLTLESARYGETYRSRRGALSESKHVFLAASGVEDLMATRGSVRVLEVGFGTGLNFLVTAATAAQAGADLEYLAAERDPLPAETIAALRYDELLPFEGPAPLLSWYRRLGSPVPPGLHTWSHARTALTLHVGEAADLVTGMGEGTVDAIYLDPFSPRANPDAWEAGLLTALAGALTPGGRLVTYSVSGAVRRCLAAAGLEVTKVPGPSGGKRESLVAVAGVP